VGKDDRFFQDGRRVIKAHVHLFCALPKDTKITSKGTAMFK
jgi:hypothetical protein